MNERLQDNFLDRLRDERCRVTVITVNGFQIKGRITGHDQDTILMDVGGQQQLVYKSAISTIVRREG